MFLCQLIFFRTTAKYMLSTPISVSLGSYYTDSFGNKIFHKTDGKEIVLIIGMTCFLKGRMFFCTKLPTANLEDKPYKVTSVKNL